MSVDIKNTRYIYLNDIFSINLRSSNEVKVDLQAKIKAEQLILRVMLPPSGNLRQRQSKDKKRQKSSAVTTFLLRQIITNTAFQFFKYATAYSSKENSGFQTL